MAKTIQTLLQRPQAAIMGIVNITPDSFSDGGQFLNVDDALKQAQRLIDQGADIVDVGGESTRPGADCVSGQEELDRVIPVITALAAEFDTPISIDTYKATVMIEAAKAGASMINDVNALQGVGAINAVFESGLPVCLMHKQGNPQNMQDAPTYGNVVDEVLSFLIHQIQKCMAAGIAQDNVIVDPGIGFGKTLEHNLQLLAKTAELKQQTGCEVLIGVSRKSMIDHLLKRDVADRKNASIALAAQAVLNGAKIVRVHDVGASYDAIRSVESVAKYQ